MIDWLITSHVTLISSSDWLFICVGRFLANHLTPLPQHAAWSDKLAEFNRVTSDRDAAREEHEGLRKKRLSEFMAGFLVITNKLKEMYQVSCFTQSTGR